MKLPPEKKEINPPLLDKSIIAHIFLSGFCFFLWIDCHEYHERDRRRNKT